MATKEEPLQKFFAKDVIKNKMITVAGQLFIEYEKKLDNSNQKIKSYEGYIGDNKIRNDILDKVCGDNVKDIFLRKTNIIKTFLSRYFLKF